MVNTAVARDHPAVGEPLHSSPVGQDRPPERLLGGELAGAVGDEAPLTELPSQLFDLVVEPRLLGRPPPQLLALGVARPAQLVSCRQGGELPLERLLSLLCESEYGSRP